jgi:hypothetical protein
MLAPNPAQWYLIRMSTASFGSTFGSHSESLGNLLGNNTRDRYIVPPFQRGYEWKEAHIKAFWKDVLKFQKEVDNHLSSGKYFLGPIVIRKREKDVIDLLDGQQRLATVTIFFSVLRDIATSIGTNDSIDFAKSTQTDLIAKEGGGFALELGETDRDYFRNAIQVFPRASFPRAKVRTNRQIEAAYRFFEEKIKQQIVGSTPEATLTVLRSYRQTLRSDFVLAWISVSSERDAFRIFETLNDRGLRLSPSDLLLNFLMTEATPQERVEIRSFWTDMIERMGRRDIARFLRHMWVSKYGDLKDIDLFSALKNHIEDKRIKGVDFARSSAEDCEDYVALVTYGDGLGNAKKHVRSILAELDAQAALPLLLAGFQKLDNENFVKLSELILVFIVRYSILVGSDSSGVEDVLFSLARDLRNQTNSPVPDLRQCMLSIKASLISKSPSDEVIKAKIPDLILGSEAAYVITKLADHMQASTREVAVTDESNLEHVFPKNPNENEWGGKANHEKLEPFLEHIGNLTIFGKRLNRVAANKEYSEKRLHYQSKSKIAMTLQLANDYEIWNETSIKHRAQKLTPLILEIWNFNNSTRV